MTHEWKHPNYYKKLKELQRKKEIVPQEQDPEEEQEEQKQEEKDN